MSNTEKKDNNTTTANKLNDAQKAALAEKGNVKEKQLLDKTNVKK